MRGNEVCDRVGAVVAALDSFGEVSAVVGHDYDVCREIFVLMVGYQARLDRFVVSGLRVYHRAGSWASLLTPSIMQNTGLTSLPSRSKRR